MVYFLPVNNSRKGGDKIPEIKRAIISVWDKTGVVDFARELSRLGVEIISTGGTAKLLREAKIPVREVSLYTGAPEMLGGRVKTLHPKIHAGILALREDPQQMEEIKKQEIELIDMVVVNLYPFAEVVKNMNVPLEKALENIDIGGPTMIRAGAKNFKNVAVISSPKQYTSILKELKQNNGKLSEKTCYRLALEAFQITSSYDSIVAEYLRKKEGIKFPSILNLTFQKIANLRYGENPHQEAAFYREWNPAKGTLPFAEKLWGKELSFNNILDFQAALNILNEIEAPFAVVIKHNNPCGAAEGKNLTEACKKAFEGDPLSAFGSIVGVNRTVDAEVANYLTSSDKFIEGIVAPEYSKEALEILKNKKPWGKKVLLLKIQPFVKKGIQDMRKIKGGILIQDEDEISYWEDKLKFVTQRHPTKKEMEDLKFAWIICKHTKSNAIVIAKDKMVVGVGAGQMSRVDSTIIAIKKAKERCKNAVLASDAFFPFPDAIEEAANAGITAIIQPGGAIRDEKVIEVANRYKMAMVFTGIRHFRH